MKQHIFYIFFLVTLYKDLTNKNVLMPQFLTSLCLP